MRYTPELGGKKFVVQREKFKAYMFSLLISLSISAFIAQPNSRKLLFSLILLFLLFSPNKQASESKHINLPSLYLIEIIYLIQINYIFTK